ncbi:hypothetical protein [Paenibacillus arenosi]|uniref:Uncharacterized protein n=1 Tax=Paenibacillus arenosi TaxID=2774142 RepID=A0ABR9B3M7_9BACL|nr:hypothetical protein [Paenibacillus arenosi]MBD8500090.1 hypothetical protein [Paenibacillus arenosi]
MKPSGNGGVPSSLSAQVAFSLFKALANAFHAMETGVKLKYENCEHSVFLNGEPNHD